MKCWISSFGENAVIAKSTAAPSPTSANRRPGDGGSGGGAGSAFAGTAGAAGAADTCTGGGGQVFSPARTTVIPRWTTSSKSSTTSPSLPGVSSVIRLTRFWP